MWHPFHSRRISTRESREAEDEISGWIARSGSAADFGTADWHIIDRYNAWPAVRLFTDGKVDEDYVLAFVTLPWNRDAPVTDAVFGRESGPFVWLMDALIEYAGEHGSILDLVKAFEPYDSFKESEKRRGRLTRILEMADSFAKYPNLVYCIRQKALRMGDPTDYLPPSPYPGILGLVDMTSKYARSLDLDKFDAVEYARDLEYYLTENEEAAEAIPDYDPPRNDIDMSEFDLAP